MFLVERVRHRHNAAAHRLLHPHNVDPSLCVSPIAMSAVRVLLLALMILPLAVALAPTSAASACYPNSGPFEELNPIWAAEYNACVTGFDRVNRLCHYCLG